MAAVPVGPGLEAWINYRQLVRFGVFLSPHLGPDLLAQFRPGKTIFKLLKVGYGKYILV